MKKLVNIGANQWVKDMNEAMRLFQALKDKDVFDKLSLKEKLEALRIGVIQH